MKKITFLTLALFPFIMATAQQELPLYGAGPIPNSKPGQDQEIKNPGSRGPWDYGLSKVSRPTLTVFLPEKGKATGMGIVVCPGGGYTHLAMGHEGLEIAHMLNENGIAAFVLKYRLPSDSTMVDKTIGPLQDAQRAIQLVRERAKEWGVDTARVGIMGFSAGGHLASTAGTHFQRTTIPNNSHVSLRPDFMILIYPVISFSDSIGHRGSRDNLIGRNPSPSLITEYSNELQVTAQTPPTFIVHAEDDRTVPVANSIHFYESLLHNKVPAELHIYPRGGHGYGLHNSTTRDQWAERLQNWLATLSAKSSS
ncbi:MAG: alpha/beta hydrolase [Bacteroidetes bacterium]|nr:alpha/beta hydrolase [Bacteroidota bacterium]